MRHRLALTAFTVVALYTTVVWAANNYRQSTSGGTVTTFKSTDTGGVHVPHINIDTLPAAPSGTNNIGKVTPNDGTNSILYDPCQTVAKSYTPISQTANTQLIAGTSAKKTYICSILLFGADAENISFVAGTGSVCATNPVAVLGGATAATGPNMAANGGFTLGNGGNAVAATTVNADNLCLFQSGSGRVAGVVTTVQQ